MLKIRSCVAAMAAFLILFICSPLWAANFLWHVESAAGGEAYILGSIHLAQPGLYPLAEPIMDSFQRSQHLVVELDIEALDQNEVLTYVRQHGLANDGRGLNERLSPQTRKILAQSPFQTERFRTLKPWMAALSLQMEVIRQHGYDEEYGLDRFFLRQARGRAMNIVELESLGEQMAPLAEMSEGESDLFFRATILELKDFPEIMGAMFTAWQKGDAAEFARIFFQEYNVYPELVPILDKVIFRRNDAMAARLEKLLSQADGPYFVVIGAGHVAGPGSVLEILADTGHRIEQL